MGTPAELGEDMEALREPALCPTMSMWSLRELHERTTARLTRGRPKSVGKGGLRPATVVPQRDGGA